MIVVSQDHTCQLGRFPNDAARAQDCTGLSALDGMRRRGRVCGVGEGRGGGGESEVVVLARP
jgi:hypothetical protein